MVKWLAEKFGRLGNSFLFRNIYIRAVLVLGFALAVICLIVWTISLPPSYPADITSIKGRALRRTISRQEKAYQAPLVAALDYLGKQPKYFAKVVNNISVIEISPTKCGSKKTPACVLSKTSGEMFSDLVFYGGAIDNVLIINPRYLDTLFAKDLALLLIHEADHIEMMSSSKLRRVTLSFYCSPFLNPGISIDSNIGDIKHRFDPIEICAEKQEEKFLKKIGEAAKYGGLYD